MAALPLCWRCDLQANRVPGYFSIVGVFSAGSGTIVVNEEFFLMDISLKFHFSTSSYPELGSWRRPPLSLAYPDPCQISYRAFDLALPALVNG